MISLSFLEPQEDLMKKSKKKSATNKILIAKKNKQISKSTKSLKTKSHRRGDGIIDGLITVVSKMSDIADSVASKFQKDVIRALKQDHDGLRQYLSTLKDTTKSLAERRKAYMQFVPLLKSHSMAEENAGALAQLQ